MCWRAASGTPGAPAAVPFELEVGFAEDDADIVEDFDVLAGVGSPEAMPDFDVCVALGADVEDDPPLDPPQPDAANTASSVAVAPMARVVCMGGVLPLWILCAPVIMCDL